MSGIYSNNMYTIIHLGSFPGDTVVKNPPANTGDARDAGRISGSRRSPRVGNDNPLQYSSLENSVEPNGLYSLWGHSRT